MAHRTNFNPSENQLYNPSKGTRRPELPPVASTSSLPDEYIPPPNGARATTRDPRVPPCYPRETIYGYNKRNYLEECYRALFFPEPTQIIYIAKEAELREPVVEKWYVATSRTLIHT